MNTTKITAFHGTTETNITEFNRPINWFTTNINYAKKFGKKIYSVILTPENIFEVGNTNIKVFNVLPVMPPYKFTKEFEELISKFNISEKEVRPFLSKLAEENGYKAGGYSMPIFTFIRTSWFGNKVKEAGYDAIHTFEEQNLYECYGILDNTKIEMIKNELFEDTRTALINKSRSQGQYKDTSRGKNRFERKKYSKVANAVKAYNQLNMDDFFKKDILTVKVPVTGETDSYTVSIKMEGVVAEIAKNVKNNKNKFEFRTIIQALTKIFNTSNIYVNCTCKDYLYNFDHWNIVNNVSSSDTAHDPGPGKGIANPKDDKGRGCKHVLLVLNNGDWMMRVASVINNYVHYAEKNMQQPFLKLIFPKIYGIPADEMVDQDIIDDEKFLDSSAGLIDAINAYGAKRGQYAKGSNKNPVTGTGGRSKKEEKPEEEESGKETEKK